jgi:hypothetical protein
MTSRLRVFAGPAKAGHYVLKASADTRTLTASAKATARPPKRHAKAEACALHCRCTVGDLFGRLRIG